MSESALQSPFLTQTRQVCQCLCLLVGLHEADRRLQRSCEKRGLTSHRGKEDAEEHQEAVGTTHDGVLDLSRECVVMVAGAGDSTM